MRISDWSSDVCSSDLGSLGMVTEHSMPAVTAALTLAAQSADLAAAAPTLANAVDDKTRAAAYGQLQSRLSRIDTTMQQVRSGQPSAAVLGEVETAGAELSGAQQKIDRNAGGEGKN